MKNANRIHQFFSGGYSGRSGADGSIQRFDERGIVMKKTGPTRRFARSKVFLVVSMIACLWAVTAQAAPSGLPILGEIERISLDNSADHYSGGTIVVGGQVVILPRNLLLDLPANRLTLKQLFEQAPAACVANGESGLAKADVCNQSGSGGYAILSANRSDFGNVIAGDVFLQKGQESITGTVTFINYNDGYYRLSGQPNVDNAGVIVRLNDPTGRHTVQQGLGCVVGSDNVNCSPDPRFTLDPDNYTNSFSNGYPYCLPSTISRTFTDIISLGTTTAQGAADGTGDILCPTTNRPASLNTAAADSRRFAPLKVGDTLTVEGNFEIIDGVKFLSAHTSSIGVALPSSSTASQPDYFTLAEVFMDAPAFYNQRYRTLIIGYTTLANPATDVLFWTIHRDKVNNEIHEIPWSSVLGCDAVAGAASCSSQGLTGAGGNIFRIRHDIDFLLAAEGPDRFGGARESGLSLCAMLRGETRFGNTSPFCPNAVTAADLVTFPNLRDKQLETGTFAEEFGIFSPIPHEIIGRTGRKVADTGGAIRNIDVSGNEATWGTYLFPFGVNLGGISLQEFNEIDLNLISTPNLFEGIPWNLDRRLGPGGCNGPCEPDVPGNPYAYALDPFPYSGFHPATALDVLVGPVAGLGGLPTGPYTDNNFTASTLSNVRDRMFSFVNTSGVFNGNATVIDNTLGAALIPPAIAIVETPALQLLVTVLPPLPVNGVTLTASPASPKPAGTQVLFVAAASGGSGSYEYQFSQNIGGVLTVVQPYGLNPGFVWNTTGLTDNTYNFQVDARSAGSVNASEASAAASYVLGVATATGVTVTPVPASPQSPGTSVVFIAAGSGGTGTYEYQFSDNVTGAMAVTQAYSQASARIWNTTGLAYGTYSIKVDARSLGSTAASEATQTIPYVLSPPPATAVTFTPSITGPSIVGTSVTWTAVASGGSGNYEYMIQLYSFTTGTWSTVKEYTIPGNTWTWDTTGLAPGTYIVDVWARSVGSTATFEAYLGVYYVLNSTTTVTFTPSVDSPIAVGTPVTWTAVASGGSGNYEYMVQLYSPVTGTWSTVKEYTVPGNTWAWDTAGRTPGTYIVDVWARNAGSTAMFEAFLGVYYVLQ